VGSREVRAFRKAGWLERRGAGHTVFRKEGRIVVVDEDSKRFPVGTLAAMRRQAGMSREAFIDFLRGG
jgi:predicted RNA binding protein YcfA (HicA-like mRNA interferase family)